VTAKDKLRAMLGQELGVKIYGEQRGAALADFNEDGRVDFVVTQNGAPTKLFQNVTAKPGLRVRLTGPVALEYEELVSVARGATLAAVLALVMVSVVLRVGLGSTRLVLVSIATLIAGLVVTAAFAAATVGDLNLISIAFVVLYIGLGFDYCIHLCLRYRELREQDTPHAPALEQAVSDVGSSLVLCAITSSVGFFAFYPTTFKGVSELGFISGSGMWIALFLSLSLLPVLLTLWPFAPSPPWRSQDVSGLPHARSVNP